MRNAFMPQTCRWGWLYALLVLACSLPAKAQAYEVNISKYFLQKILYNSLASADTTNAFNTCSFQLFEPQLWQQKLKLPMKYSAFTKALMQRLISGDEEVLSRSNSVRIVGELQQELIKEGYFFTNTPTGIAATNSFLAFPAFNAAQLWLLGASYWNPLHPKVSKRFVFTTSTDSVGGQVLSWQLKSKRLVNALSGEAQFSANGTPKYLKLFPASAKGTTTVLQIWFDSSGRLQQTELQLYKIQSGKAGFRLKLQSAFTPGTKVVAPPELLLAASPSVNLAQPSVKYATASISELSQAKIVLGKVSLPVRRLFGMNQLEGLRVGVGLSTNLLFSNRFSLSGYGGYGTKDRQWKFGGEAKYFFSKNRFNYIELNAQQDIQEPGAAEYALKKPQFFSQLPRQFAMSVFDYVQKAEAAFTIKTAPFLRTRLSASVQHTTPGYTYRFKGEAISSFTLTETSVEFGYQPSSRWLAFPLRMLLLKGATTGAWLKFSHGAGSQFNYSRLDASLRLRKRLVGFGELTAQLLTEKVWGTAPFSKLSNGRGSYRPRANMAHNYFETMRFNEFMSDHLVAGFFTVRFGPIGVLRERLLPTVDLAQHVAWGQINNLSEHVLAEGDAPFGTKSMQKGYYESGILLRNIVVVKLGVPLFGVGAGAFFRYGPERLAGGIQQNTVVKLAFSAIL